MNFWARNEGQLIGTLGGVLIAILAAYLTYFFSVRQINKKEKDAYQGLLYTLHVELYWQNHHFELLKKILKKLNDFSVQNQAFAIENAPIQFDLSISEKVLLTVIDYKYYSPELVALLTSYLNQIRNINYFLDFKNANELILRVSDEKDKEERISDYFNVLNTEYINKTQPVISEMLEIIKIELKDYPIEKMVFEEKIK